MACKTYQNYFYSFPFLLRFSLFALGTVNSHLKGFFYRRCATVDGNRYTVEDHTLPFSNVLPKNPSIEDMKRLYAVKKSKEDLLFIPSRWENDTVRVTYLFSIMAYLL